MFKWATFPEILLLGILNRQAKIFLCNSFECLCYLNFSLKIFLKYNLIFENVLNLIRLKIDWRLEIGWSIKMHFQYFQYFQYSKRSGRFDV